MLQMIYPWFPPLGLISFINVNINAFVPVVNYLSHYIETSRYNKNTLKFYASDCNFDHAGHQDRPYERLDRLDIFWEYLGLEDGPDGYMETIPWAIYPGEVSS